MKITTSSFPNTTLDFIKVRHVHLGFPLYDTPGLPSQHQCHLESYSDFNKNNLVTKQISPVVLPLYVSSTLFIGGIAKIDLISGNNLDLYVYCNTTISLHCTNIEKANSTYIRNYGALLTPVLYKDIRQAIFEKHEIEIICNSKGISEQEIEIFGIGIIGFRSNRIFETKTTIFLYLP